MTVSMIDRPSPLGEGCSPLPAVSFRIIGANIIRQACSNQIALYPAAGHTSAPPPPLSMACRTPCGLRAGTRDCIAGRKGGNENLLDIGAESIAILRAIAPKGAARPPVRGKAATAAVFQWRAEPQQDGAHLLAPARGFSRSSTRAIFAVSAASPRRKEALVSIRPGLRPPPCLFAATSPRFCGRSSHRIARTARAANRFDDQLPQ